MSESASTANQTDLVTICLNTSRLDIAILEISYIPHLRDEVRTSPVNPRTGLSIKFMPLTTRSARSEVSRLISH